MQNELWRLTITAPQGACDLVQALLANEAPFGWEEKPGDPCQFELYWEDRWLPEKIAQAASALADGITTEIAKTENRDWQAAWRQYFTPVEAGDRFVILPPWLAHMEHTRRQPIIINPKNAFGTGHHASTVLCLVSLSELLDTKKIGKNDWFLDLGCGTGILGLAACKAGLSGTGLDIDPVAIANSRENRELNEVTHLELLVGDIKKVRGEKFDLIMANILAEPLIAMAPVITAALKPKGCLILGGILASQAQAVSDAYRQCGLAEPRILAQDEWRAIVWD